MTETVNIDLNIILDAAAMSEGTLQNLENGVGELLDAGAKITIDGVATTRQRFEEMVEQLRKSRSEE